MHRAIKITLAWDMVLEYRRVLFRFGVLKGPEPIHVVQEARSRFYNKMRERIRK